MIKRFYCILLCLGACASLMAESKDFAFKFYGQIRADLFYNTRANNEMVDGLFYLYPKNNEYDALGNDLNATPQGNMYVLYTRLGLDVTGPVIGSVKTSAKIEIDFRGSGSNFAVTRIRQAYAQMQYKRSTLLVGQTWHPLFGEVSPSMLNLSTGAPFQPFSRAPLVRYRYNTPGGIMLTAATIWQMQFNSNGPDGKTWNYLKNSGIPELYASIDYRTKSAIVGCGVEMLSLKPRLQSVIDDKIYKVNERVTSVSVEAHAKYTGRNFIASAKTVYANNLTHCSTLGGFAATYVNPQTGEMDYTPFRHSMSWVNLVYGKKWQPGLFVGYLKNLGTGHSITGPIYGTGLDVDQLFSINAQISFNLPFCKIGFEFEPSTAWYGDIDYTNGRIKNTHSVTNYRFLLAAMYIF